MAPSLNLPAPANGSDDTLAPKADAKPKFSSGGIIFPPPDIRTTVDKTADFVARNGATFEAKIKSSEQSNPKFSFLNQDDPYHPYYLQRIQAVKDGSLTQTPPSASTPQTESQPSAAAAAAVSPNQAAPPVDKVPEEPEPFEFSADLPNITAIDLDIIKLTALFTARKGRAFATALAAREARSFQFEFLRPSHSLHAYFNRLVEQYQKVMHPPKELISKVRAGTYGSPEASSSTHRHITGVGAGGARPLILEQSRQRAEYEKWARDKRKLADEQAQKDKAAFDEIDWQDFVVVGTIELTETDEHVDLPLPRSIRELESMTMAQKKMAAMIMETDGQDDEEVEELDMPRPGQASASAPAPDSNQGNTPSASATATEEIRRSDGQAPIKIRKDYVPRGIAGKQTGPQTTKCPVCGLDVPIDEMSEHVRFELLDPRYREQRRELEAKKSQQAALQAGADPTYFLRQFANSRTDLFGTEADEEARAKREAEERRLAKEREKFVWDGRAVSRSAAKDLYQKNVGLEEQINQLHRKPQAPAPTYGPMIPGQEPQPQPIVGEGTSPLPLPGPGLPQRPQVSMMEGAASPLAGTVPLAGIKRSADGDPAGQPPLQRPAMGGDPYYAEAAYQSASPVPVPAPGSLGKNADGSLQPESVWIEHNPNPVNLRVHLPDAPNVSSKADGRVLDFQAAPTASIGSIRDWVHAVCLASEVGASKLKIKIAGRPATLRQTVAHWNLVDGDEVLVSIAK